MFGRFLTTGPGSALRVFAGVVLGALVLSLQSGDCCKASQVWPWVSAGLIVAVPILIAWVNPSDTRFGRRRSKV